MSSNFWSQVEKNDQKELDRESIPAFVFPCLMCTDLVSSGTGVNLARL
jgi:hypothetical protein